VRLPLARHDQHSDPIFRSALWCASNFLLVPPYGTFRA
jgi:hypothetical protein